MWLSSEGGVNGHVVVAAIECAPLASPANGRVTYSKYNKDGLALYPSTATYTCDENYVLTGMGPNTIVSCGTDGQWTDANTPNCIRESYAEGSVRREFDVSVYVHAFTESWEFV